MCPDIIFLVGKLSMLFTSLSLPPSLSHIYITIENNEAPIQMTHNEVYGVRPDPADGIEIKDNEVYAEMKDNEMYTEIQ